jgi:hypothetical protein
VEAQAHRLVDQAVVELVQAVAAVSLEDLHILDREMLVEMLLVRMVAEQAEAALALLETVLLVVPFLEVVAQVLQTQ